jgi:aspartyl-tRNA(Asn)/glutamyl-tRNA(Gln) amidotransferase subunit A
MDLAPLSLTVTAALKLLRAREISAAGLTRLCLEQIERFDPRLNAFITVVPESAMSQAEQADALLARSPADPDGRPLLGIPLALKDLIETAGVRTTGGSRFFRESVPSEDAEAVLRLKQAGAVVLGKTGTHEVALGLTGINPLFGPVHNPWNPERISGGSSSGSAAAVAAGLCLAALGTDTGGSIRVPAALCGVVGLKPTYGRISVRGVMPLSWNLDHLGPLTRSVRDAALLLQVLAGFDPQDPASLDAAVDDYLGSIEAGPAGWRLALAAGDYAEACEAAVASAVTGAARVFEDLGAKIVKEDLSWMAELARANSLMTQADAAAFHRQRLTEHPDWFGEDVRQRLQTGAAFTSAEYILARRTQAEGRRRFEQLMAQYDLLLLPTVPAVAPPIEGSQALEAARQFTRFTSSFNLTGLPALSVPCGLSPDGLPIGLQLAAGPWREARLLQAGHAYEQAVGGFKHPTL